MAGSFQEVAHFLGGEARDFIAGLKRGAVSRSESEVLARDALVHVIDHGELK